MNVYFAIYSNEWHGDYAFTAHSTEEEAVKALREWVCQEEDYDEEERGDFRIVRGVEVPLRVATETKRKITLEVRTKPPKRKPREG